MVRREPGLSSSQVISTRQEVVQLVPKRDRPDVGVALDDPPVAGVHETWVGRP
jgi:hypothetical protein